MSSITVPITNRDTGAPLDATTFTCVVTRNDTAAVVTSVATHPQTGQYTWTWTDPAFDLTYTLSYTVAILGAIHTWTEQYVGPMTASTTYWTYKDLRDRLLAHYSSPGTAETTEAGQIVNDGYLKFLMDFDWSFITRTGTLSLTLVGVGAYTLATDFAAMVGDPVITLDTRSRRLEQRTPEWVLERVERSYRWTGIPTAYAVQPAAFVAATGQRWQLLTYPWPDATYTATYEYRFAPSPLSLDADYPLGGSQHGLTILQAALMLWEERKGNTAGLQRALYFGDKVREGYLPASIKRDTVGRAHILGRTPTPTATVRPLGQVTYGGVL